MKRSEEYQRRILLVVTGMSPQIITETLYALTQRKEDRFLPTEIHLISTSEGIEIARLELFQGQDPKFSALQKEYELPNILFDNNCLHILKDKNGQPLNDIRSESDNMAAADQLNHLVQQLTQDEENSVLHVSIAGGRKTMGYYLGYSLSLWGRHQDRLSHVLVSEGFESNPLFWFPTKASKIIYSRDDKPLDTKSAEVTLADIPFVRLREELPKNALVNNYSFKEVVKQLQPIENKVLVFDYENKCVLIGDIEVNIETSLLAFYGWIARRKIEGKEGVVIPVDNDPNLVYAEEYLNEYILIVGEFDLKDSRTERALKKGMDKGFFEPKKSKLLTELALKIGRKNLIDFNFSIQKINGTNYHQIDLPADKISWK